MDASASTLEADDRANELYWGSDLSVNQIADALDLSKGALYGMIRPLPAERACPVCGTEAVHPNRTAKERGLVACPSCGWEGLEDQAPSVQPSGTTPPATLPSPRTNRSLRGRSSTLAVGALLGAAAGLALILWVRRR